MDGPFDVAVDQDAGANSWVFRPNEFGKDGVKHPIFVWDTGATSVPMQYMDHFTRVASRSPSVDTRSARLRRSTKKRWRCDSRRLAERRDLAQEHVHRTQLRLLQRHLGQGDEQELVDAPARAPASRM